MTQPNGWTGVEIDAIQDVREEERRRWAIAVAASLMQALLTTANAKYTNATDVNLIALAQDIEEYVRGK